MAFSAKSMIEQMEARYKELAVKLEGFTQIQEEMTTLSRAIKVMRGEKLTPGGPKGPRKSKQEWAGKIIAASEDEHVSLNGNSEAIKQILRSNPKGLTVGEIWGELRKQGVSVTTQTVHNAFRSIQAHATGTKRNPTGQKTKIYTLKKGDQ